MHMTFLPFNNTLVLKGGIMASSSFSFLSVLPQTCSDFPTMKKMKYQKVLEDELEKSLHPEALLSNTLICMAPSLHAGTNLLPLFGSNTPTACPVPYFLFVKYGCITTKRSNTPTACPAP